MTEKEGIKETTELVDGIMEILIFIASSLHWSDFGNFWDKLTNSAETKDKIKEAFDGITKVRAELADLSTREKWTLLKQVIGYVPRLITALF